MAIKRILGGKSKNLFDIDKFVDTNSVKRSGNNLICSAYGTSIGTLGSICPTLKLSDTITVSFKSTSEGVASNFMSMSTTSGGLKIFTSGETFLVSEVGLSAQWYVYNTDYEHRAIPNKTTYSDIQLELGSTATEYVPHELTSYKSIMKVSDVCQLIDKSKFTASGTTNGITWVSNGDGSITLNGTCTDGFALNPFNQQIPVDQTHFYYTSPYLSINYGGRIDGTYETGGIGYIKISAQPTKFNTVFYIWIDKDKSFSNVTTFINIDDLTEIFGAGNEPKTVAEFKAKFPNDYYPYSPSCFVTSFDERMPCKTKNLFSSSTEVGIPSSAGFDKSEKRLLEDGKWYVGLSKNNYYRGPQSDWLGNFQYNIRENSISLYTNLDGFGLAKCVYVEPNTKYTISCKVNGPDLDIGCGFYQEDGTFIDFFSGEEITTPQNCKFITIVFSLGIDRNKVTHYVSNIQLVKGTTATDYVPYGYV